MDLPVNVSTGMVVGRYIADVIDGADTNLEPDAISVQGRIVFTASVPYLPNPTAGPDPVTIMRVPIVGVLDQDGYLCTPYPGTLEPQYRGVRLIATDDPDIAVTDWTWDVTYFFEPVNGHKLAIPAHDFALPSGGTVDLTKVAKVPSSPGYGLPQAEAAVLRAEGAAVSSAEDAALAVAAADRAELVAGATDAGVAILLGDAGTETGALLEDALAPKADIVAVDGALAFKADLTGGKVPDAQTPAGVTTSLNNLSAVKADKSTVENELAFKADLTNGKVPVAQLPTDALVTDANVAAQVNGSQTGAAIDSRITTQATPLVHPIVADYIASSQVVVDAAAAAVNANPKIATIEVALSVLNGKGQRGYEVKETAGRTVAVWDYLNNREQLIYGDTGIRDITALAPNVTSGKLYLYRDGSTVTLIFDVVQMAGASGSSYDMIPAGGIPTGFRPTRTFWFNGIDGPPGARRIGVSAAGWVPVYLSPVPGDYYRGTITWRTTQPWPTSLPGVAA